MKMLRQMFKRSPGVLGGTVGLLFAGEYGAFIAISALLIADILFFPVDKS